MIEIRADRERVTIEHNGKERVISAADQGEAPYQRPVRIRAHDSIGSVVLTLRWNWQASHVRVDVERWFSFNEIMSTDVQTGDNDGGLNLTVYTAAGKYKVSRLRKKK